MDTVSTGALINMDADESVLTRKELRRQKLMEYLAAKGKLKLPNIPKKPNVSKDEKVKTYEISAHKDATDKENETPVHKSSNKLTNKLTTKVKSLAPQPIRCDTRPLGMNNKENIKGSNLAQKQNSKNLLAINKGAKANHFPVFSRTYSVVTSKSTVNGFSNLKKQPHDTRQRSAGMASTNTHINKVTNNRMSSSTNAASASMKNTVNGRMIYGPIVKTRTGLIPAVTLPKNTKSNIATPSHITKTTDNKVRSSSLYKHTSQESNIDQRKTISTVTLNKTVNKNSVTMTAKTGNKTQNKCNGSLRNCIQPSLKHDLSASRCTVKSIKTNVRAGTFRTNVSVGQPRTRSEVIRNKSRQEVTHPTSVPAARGTFKVYDKVTAANPEVKTKMSRETERKKPGTSTKANQARGDTKRNEIPAISQTAPQPSRTISLTNKATYPKTPQVRGPPQSAQKTLTAAQEERIKKLQEWREARGISYKRPSMLPKTQTRRTVAVPQPFWSSMNEEDEAHSLICAVDRSLADCIKLLREGCPTQQVKEVLSRLPVVAQKFAKYWICQARLMEQEGHLDVLPLFEKAVGVVLEPVDELRTVVFEILKKRDENQVKEDDKEEPAADKVKETTSEVFNSPVMTPKPVRALISGEKGDSSVVKYKITATPGGPPGQQAETTVVNGQEVRFFTPVRRSVRIERASLRYPVSLQDHDLCVASYNDLIAEEEKEKSGEQSECETGSVVTNTPLYIYRENEALKDKVSVEFLCSDA